MGICIVSYLRNYIIIGVTSFNLGCNTILTDSGESRRLPLLKYFYSKQNKGEKLPSVFADVRGKKVMDFIETQTAGATFCRRSDKVQEVKGGKGWSMVRE